MLYEDIYDDSVVLGGGTDTLNDGRTFRYEAWCDCGYTLLTYTLPIKGFEDFTKEKVVEYLIEQGLNIDLESFPIEEIDVIRARDNIKITITCGESED